MKEWPADNVTRFPLDRLIPYANNARIHSDSQIAQIAASMKEWGWTNPVLVDETGGIIAGHGRVLAARKLGLTEAPVMVATGWTEAQKRAYVLADNQLALNASWNLEALSVELQGLDAMGFDLELLGFGDLAALMVDKTAGLTDPDEVPEAPVNPASVTGDVWILGKHRLVCGDATNAEDVVRALNGVSPSAVITDPPYNVGIEYGQSNNDQKSNEDYIEFTRKWFDLALACSSVVLLTPGTGRGMGMPNLQMWYKIRAPDWTLIWIKKNAVGHSSIGGFNNWEPIFFYGKTKRKIGQDIYDIPITVQKDVANSKGKKLHPTPKQVKLWSAMIDDFTSGGQAVYEPFSGSGTTLIAAEIAGRFCHAIEIEPAYIDVAVKRWQNFTGKAATLEGDGRTFEAISQERYDIATREKDYEASCVVGTADMREKLLNGQSGREASRKASRAAAT